MEILDREIKGNNAILTKKNTELHNSLLEMRGMYVLLKRRNLRLMKDSSRLYRMVRLSRLENKNSNPRSQAHFTLETIAEVVTSFQDPEAAHDVVALSNPMQIEERLEGQRYKM